MDKRLIDKLDWPLLIFGGVIVLIGLANLYSATYGQPVARFFNNQLVWVSMGTFLALVVSLINYNFLERISYFLYAIALFLLILVLHTSDPIAGSVRWFRFGWFSLQPSELMKPMIVLVMARAFNRRDDRPPYHLHQLIWPFMLLLVPMYFIHKQPDLGTTLALGITGFSMMLFVGIQRKSLVMLAVTIMLLIPVAWFFLLSNYQKERVVTFMEPEKYRLEGGYQVIQSKIAVGSGMIVGRGYLNGSQTKLNFLPKQYTDFAFSNFAEEMGFVGCITFMFLYLLFILAGLNIALKAKDRSGMLLAFGFTCYFFWHAFINISMVLGLLPVVGIPLPLISYGGSSAITSFFAIGVLLSISVRRFMF